MRRFTVDRQVSDRPMAAEEHAAAERHLAKLVAQAIAAELLPRLVADPVQPPSPAEDCPDQHRAREVEDDV